VDLSFGMLAAARTTAPLLQGDALRLPLPDGSVDAVTCGFALRNFASLPPFFAELARVVKPGGRVALLEVAEPPNRLLRFGHGLYFGKVVPLVGGLLSDPAAYRYLPRSVAYLPDPGTMLGQLADAGFVQVERRLLSVGIAQLITATRR
jgi:demethylmenaquinone methyltransferase/2-methoxy-6-polyprenyl-1,4-benzoquinol methylase